MQLQENMLFDDRYLLKKLLGCGGFSEVWLVEDAKVGNKKMALKVYAPGAGLDEDGVRLFSSEFELVFDLNHTHLLRPSHFDVCERSPYLLMPFSEQGSATKLIGHFSEEDAWRFLHDVAAGLAYLHAQEPPIIHQDVKPDNILKDYQGNYQITDFGISTKVRSTLRKSVNNAMSAGTLAYMPPERFGKDNIPIKASDIWAMGATLFELLSGELPFGEHGGLIQKSGAEIPNIPGGEWSDELREIVVRCLQKDPWDRPVAQQIAEWSDKYFKGEIENIFESKVKKPVAPSLKFNIPDKKTIWKIAGGVVIFLLSFTIVRNCTSGHKEKGVLKPKAETEIMRPIESEISLPIDSEWMTEHEQIDACDSVIETRQVAEEAKPATPTTVTASPAAWVAEHDRIMSIAKTAYDRQDYEIAKEEYNKALVLVIQNRDTKRQAAINERIASCNKGIEAKKEAAIQERLASYHFVGNFTLGSTYMVVQRKSDNRWGIIDQEGNVVEAITYSQVSARLKNGYYALKNEKGWFVFDDSLKKVASGIDKLDKYQ